MRTHLDAVFLCPTFFKGHHEVGRQRHFLELPFTILPDVLVVVSRGHQKCLSVEDRFSLKISEALSPVATNLNDVVVDELLYPGNARAVTRLGARFVQCTEEALEFFRPFGLTKLAKSSSPSSVKRVGIWANFPSLTYSW